MTNRRSVRRGLSWSYHVKPVIYIALMVCVMASPLAVWGWQLEARDNARVEKCEAIGAIAVENLNGSGWACIERVGTP